MHRFLFIIALAVLLLPTAVCSAQDSSDVANLIQKKYDSVQSFEADFVQVQTRAAIGISSEFSGHIWYKNPSLVRWETR
ncbi:MAG: outer membrane lipoprotein carrier protein LolA, partial [Proteobacteria bacterium]|nr:outer membrane lipoprotein carrier protein LolA [Pseudomonadota bacterium]